MLVYHSLAFSSEFKSKTFSVGGVEWPGQLLHYGWEVAQLVLAEDGTSTPQGVPTTLPDGLQ
eukprot:8856159-Lingulodinium_polyedra.AAC.1